MTDPEYLAHERFATLREGRGFELEIPGLWVAGALEGLTRPSVAVVGTRAATAYGRRIASRFAYDLGRAGCCIISGLALGIDAAAHLGALEAGAPTIGVLGGGHGHFFPRRNADLAERILANGGAVLSPFPPEQSARPHQFLQRNGIVAALADAVLVVEAPSRSGALNTAGWAAGRIPVLAVPGDIDRAHSAGCHALLRDGAILARSADDVLELLHIAVADSADARSVPADPVAAHVLAALANGERELDGLLEDSPDGTSAVLATLAQLELDGIVERSGGNRFARIR